MKIARLDHPVLTVRSIPRSVDFYTRVMGMKAVTLAKAARRWRSGSKR